MNTIKQKTEEKNELVEQFEASMSEDPSSEKLDGLKEDITNLNKEIENLRFAESQRAENAKLHEGSEDKPKFSFRDMLNFTRNPSSVSNDKQDYYGELNMEGTKEARNAGASLQGNGFVIPQKVMNAVDVGTEGEDVLYDQQGAFIQALRDRMVLSDLGVRYLNNLQGDVRFPKQTKKASFSWEGETSTASAEDTEYVSVTLAPKRGFSAIDFSNQMLAQESLQMEALIRDDIMNSIVHGVERTAINGGGVNAPQGILDVATEVVSGGNLYADVVNLESEVASKNVFGEYGYLMAPSYRATAKTTSKDEGSGMFVWEQGNTVNGHQTGVTSAANDDIIIFGDFSQLLIGDFSGVEILVDPYTKSRAGQTSFICNVYMGTAIRHDEGFAYIDTSPA